MGGYYIYEHWRPDTDVCFYVGKGKGRRANVMYGRDEQHKRIQEKLKSLGMCVEVRLVISGLGQEEALDQEVKRIAFWRALEIQLVNRTAGGDGGQDPCEETRAKMRKAKLGRKLSEEHRKKIADKVKERFKNPEERKKISIHSSKPDRVAFAKNLHTLIPRTKEHYEKVSAALKGKKLSPERVEKTRQANLGRKQSPEEIERRRAANKGRKRTEEFRARMRAMWTPERKAAHALKMAANKELLEKMRAANIGNAYTLGKKHSDETRQKRREAHVRRKNAAKSLMEN